jgi:DNA mismatch repair protein MutS
MFFDDAREAAPLLGIALTARHRDSDIEAPMCGVPWQSADITSPSSSRRGRKVAVCDQSRRRDGRGSCGATSRAS